MISGIILTHNNQDQISFALKSLDFCDEIIVIDDFSNDNTLAITQKFTSKIFKHSLNQDFSAQRNFGLNLAKNDWVLFLDADEIIPQALKTELVKISQTSHQGCYLKRTDTFMGHQLKYGETGAIKLLRFARRNSGFWHRPVHEIWRITGSVVTARTPIIHHPHQSITAFIQKIDYYSTIEANFRTISGSSWSIINTLVFPIGKFIHNLIFKMGFLDGFPGISMAFMMSLYSLILRIKIYEASRR